MKFKREVLVVVVLCITSTIACYVSIPVSVGDPQPVPALDIPASHLLLDVESFPSDWKASSCDPDCANAERADEALREFGKDTLPGHVIQQVFHFASEDDALAKFVRYEETDAFSSSEEISYLSPIADKQYIHCGVDETPGCKAGLQYDNYFVYFYFDIDDGRGYGLKMEEVEPILQAMDERVSELLNAP
jgi:hypothetical protein